jgi:hypothetical protein
MKKIGLILFIGCLAATAFTGNQCRKKVTSTPIDTSVVVVPPKDTAGEDLHVQVYLYNITGGSQVAGKADLFLLNNFNDYKDYTSSKKLTSTYIVKAQADDLGVYTFAKVKPSSINPPHDFKGPGGGSYEYHIIARYPRNVGDTLWGEWQQGGNAAPIPVNINNGLNGAGLNIPIAVNP